MEAVENKRRLCSFNARSLIRWEPDLLLTQIFSKELKMHIAFEFCAWARLVITLTDPTRGHCTRGHAGFHAGQVISTWARHLVNTPVKQTRLWGSNVLGHGTAHLVLVCYLCEIKGSRLIWLSFLLREKVYCCFWSIVEGLFILAYDCMKVQHGKVSKSDSFILTPSSAL